VPRTLGVALGVVVASAAALLLWLSVSALAEVSPVAPGAPAPGAGWPVPRSWPLPTTDPVCTGHAPAPRCH
jgi:hypothetical protein